MASALLTRCASCDGMPALLARCHHHHHCWGPAQQHQRRRPGMTGWDATHCLFLVLMHLLYAAPRLLLLPGAGGVRSTSAHASLCPVLYLLLNSHCLEAS